MKNIVNIVNFVRSYDKRENIDLVEPVKEQLRLMRENDLRGTFLLQYDAAVTEPYPTLMKENADLVEVGLWFEIVEPLVEAVGEKWRGRFPVWDWSCNVGSPVGYAPEMREKLIDACMRKFKDVFGYYPPCVGAWQIDAYSMRVFAEKYGVKACCICRDQLQTDYYTLGGGYYDKAYYPSKNNMLCPARTKETQIDMPVFRMLGNDPIYAYDFKNRGYALDCAVPTLEPIGAGGNDAWVDWFFKENFGGNGMVFGYAQAGQENSFGWDGMKHGLAYQFPLIAKWRDEGRLSVETLSETGAWFKETFAETPASTMTALSDWLNAGRKSVWYSSKFYRANLMFEGGRAYLRDLYLFDDTYDEKYLNAVCTAPDCENRNLPVFDGVIYGMNDPVPGIFFEDESGAVVWDDFRYTETDGRAVITLTKGEKTAVVTFHEGEITVETNVENLVLVPVYDRERVYGRDKGKLARYDITYITKAEAKPDALRFEFDGKPYAVRAKTGAFRSDFSAVPEGGNLRVCFVG